jgi:hypothetical protein
MKERVDVEPKVAPSTIKVLQIKKKKKKNCLIDSIKCQMGSKFAMNDTQSIEWYAVAYFVYLRSDEKQGEFQLDINKLN